MILAIVMILSLGANAFAGQTDGAEIDIRKSVAPDTYNYSRSINSDEAVIAVPETTTESNFVREIGGKEFDIRRNVLSKEGITAVKDGQGENISPTLWPGDGPAPQVTDIQLADYGWLENGNFGVIIKVYGYGSDNTTFDGRSISWIEREPFIISGTGADGFYYLYDCGPITQEDDYIFATTFTSTNFPYSQRSYSTTFTFTNN